VILGVRNLGVAQDVVKEIKWVIYLIDFGKHSVMHLEIFKLPIEECAIACMLPPPKYTI